MAKRVLLTGAAGFAGSHALRHLLAETDFEIVCPVTFRHRGNSDRIASAIQDNDEWHQRTKVVMHDLTAPLPALADRVGHCDYVIAMAAESSVDQSIDAPVPFIRNNVDVILTTLEYARTAHPGTVIVFSTDEVYGPMLDNVPHAEWSPVLPSNPYAASKAAQEAVAISYWRTYGVPVILVNCFDTSMRVLTPDGFKGYGQLKVGDRVWALDGDENLVLEPVLRLMRRPGDGRMIRIKGKGVSQLVTRDHRMMIRRAIGQARRWQPIEEIPAADLLRLKGRVRVPRTGHWTGADSPVFCPDEHAGPPPARASAARGRGWAPKRLPAEMPTEQVAALFGWFISEGCVSRGTVRFGARSAAQQQVITEHLSGIDGRAYINDGQAVCIANGHLAALLGLAGAGARNKSIPAFIRNLDVKYLHVFFDAMIAGDGTRYGAGAVYYTASPLLAEQMCEIGIKLGYSARISERETWNPARTMRTRSYVARLTPCAGEIEARNVTEEDYDGDVWCLSVPSGRVFVERDGIVSLSGQSMNLIGEMQDPVKFLPKVISYVRDGRMMPIYGVPGDIGSRYFIHARNVASALLHILTTLPPAAFPAAQRPDRYNIVGEKRLTNLELALMVAEIVGAPLSYELVNFHAARAGHDPHYGLDGSKLAAAGWKPPMNFAESLASTVRWSLAHPEWL
jgi:dTDP-D-glucose 4,6-dehydratase